jgi:hypothetical protein
MTFPHFEYCRRRASVLEVGGRGLQAHFFEIQKLIPISGSYSVGQEAASFPALICPGGATFAKTRSLRVGDESPRAKAKTMVAVRHIGMDVAGFQIGIVAIGICKPERTPQMQQARSASIARAGILWVLKHKEPQS